MLYNSCSFCLELVVITNKMEHFSFKSGCGMQVMKLIKEDWPIVLQFILLIIISLKL